MTGDVGFSNLIAFVPWPFGSGWMLLWSLVAIAPLLIHFWSRRRYTEVAWAAMEYLLTAIRQNARRWKIEQLILLLTRIAIVCLLSIALADPVASFLTGFGGTQTVAGETHVVLVLDASYSMDYRETHATRFDLAKGLAIELVHEGQQGDGFTLIRMADPPMAVISEPAFDPKDVEAEIGELTRSDGGADLLATLGQIEKVVDRATTSHDRLVRKRVCFFTDLGLTTWQDVTTESARAVLARLAEKADLQVVDVSQGAAQNSAVTSLLASEGVVTAGQPTRLDIELENFGNQDRLRQKVEILVDGQRISEDQVDIPAGGHVSLSTMYRFPVAGEHVVEARLGPDRLEVDNHRWLSVVVRPVIEVLCIEGKSNAAKNVAFALEPGRAGQRRLQPVVRSEIALLEEELDRYACIFMCNVGRLGRDEARVLRNFVQRGGGLVFFLGDRVQGENYNSLLGADSEEGRLLPARLSDPVAIGEYLFDPLDYQHPVVAPFRGNERAGLLMTTIWKYFKLDPYPSSNVEEVLAFENGDPAILEEAFGAGLVLLVATDGSMDSMDLSTTPPTPWSVMAAWPSFPPLVQELLRAAIRGRVQLRNVSVGGSLQGWMPPGVADASVVVRDRTGRSQRVPGAVTENESRWVFDKTDVSGPYDVQIGGPSGVIQKYAVNLDTHESQVEQFAPERLPSQFLREARAESGAVAQPDTATPVHFFRYVLAVVLFLLVCETFLAWFFGRSAA